MRVTVSRVVPMRLAISWCVARLKDGRIAFRRATHQEIANRIGTTRETVTRMLKEIERQGLIEIDGKEIVVQPDFEKAF